LAARCSQDAIFQKDVLDALETPGAWAGAGAGHESRRTHDMQQAPHVARQMVTRWGMSARLGPVTLAPRDGGYTGADGFGLGQPRSYSETTAGAIDAEVQRLVEEAAAEAVHLLELHRRELDDLAEALLEQETLDEPGIRPRHRTATDSAVRAGAVARRRLHGPRRSLDSPHRAGP
jgi:hypothetical protein